MKFESPRTWTASLLLERALRQLADDPRQLFDGVEMIVGVVIGDAEQVRHIRPSGLAQRLQLLNRRLRSPLVDQQTRL